MPKVPFCNAMIQLKKVYNAIFPLKYFNYPEYLENKFVAKLAKKARGKKVLDVGAGGCRFKPYFEKSEYISQDICDKDIKTGYDHIDIRSEIYNIPVKDNSFDFILCTQVLEHLKYPNKAFEEFHRILKPKGELWVSVPFAGAEHQIPYDYFRYTKYALEMFGEDNSFKVVTLETMGGRFTCFALFLKNLLPNITEKPLPYLVLSILQFPFLILPLIVLYHLDKFDKKSIFPAGFFVVYRSK